MSFNFCVLVIPLFDFFKKRLKIGREKATNVKLIYFEFFPPTRILTAST